MKPPNPIANRACSVPNVTLKQLASSHAADTASAILLAGLDAPASEVRYVVAIEDADLCVEVVVRRCKQTETPCSETAITIADADLLRHLSPIELEIMIVATSKPVTVKALMAKTEYENYPYFAAAVRKLVDMKLLARAGGCVRKNITSR